MEITLWSIRIVALASSLTHDLIGLPKGGTKLTNIYFLFRYLNAYVSCALFSVSSNRMHAYKQLLLSPIHDLLSSC